MLDALPGSSYTNGFGFSSRSWPQREFHSCYAGPGYLSGRLVFDGAGTAPFPLSTVMQTSLLAGALTSSSLMSCYRYASHVSIFPFWTFLLLHLPHNPSPHTLPSLPSPARARTQEGLKRGSPSHLGSLKTKKKSTEPEVRKQRGHGAGHFIVLGLFCSLFKWVSQCLCYLPYRDIVRIK